MNSDHEIYEQFRHGPGGVSSNPSRRLVVKPWALFVALVFCMLSALADAATLNAIDDSFGIPYDTPLQVDAFGVMENDLVDGASAGDLGALAELVLAPSHGILSCPSNGALSLCQDGSFSYTPDAAYTGSDSFTYRFQYGGANSNTATVKLTACNGGPAVFSCWTESAYLAKLAELGYVSFTEGFEESPWDVAREPTTAASVTSKGIIWRSNHPATNNITTGMGAAHSGLYGIYDPDHGYATGSAVTCDINNPPSYCLYHDGFSGSRVIGEGALHGVGGFISGTYGANLAVIIDGVLQIGLGKLQGSGGQFFGVINTDPNGFGAYEFRELDGKVGQLRIIFGDDFTIAIDPLQGNVAPVANAGVGQTVAVGDTVTLDASASSDLDGDTLSYSWSFTSLPIGSTAQLSDPSAMKPTFVADMAGSYVARLIVNDGQLNSTPDSVTVSTVNTAPVANAGVGQTVAVGAMVILDGSASSDVDGDPLSYSWTLVAKPGGSNASLSNPTSVKPSFIADLSGDYIAQLMVNDGVINSAPDSVTVSTVNTAPIANAGADQVVALGATAALDGSASSDVDGNVLSYRWSLITKPVGSNASLSSSTVVKPSFVADIAGNYVAQLIVNDGMTDSAPDTVTISASTQQASNTAPVAEAGAAQTVNTGTTVVLDGSASLDRDGDILSYRWSLIAMPAGSNAQLASDMTVSPSFAPDVAGVYVAQLIVSDGQQDSPPDSVSITVIDAGGATPVRRGGGGGGGGVWLPFLLGALGWWLCFRPVERRRDMVFGKGSR